MSSSFSYTNEIDCEVQDAKILIRLEARQGGVEMSHSLEERSTS